MFRRPLTGELADKNSPVRRFLDERFSSGLRDVQRRYRQDAPSLVVPSADRQEANPGTVGTAADWLLRFLLYPRPSLKYAARGAACHWRLAAPNPPVVWSPANDGGTASSPGAKCKDQSKSFRPPQTWTRPADVLVLSLLVLVLRGRGCGAARRGCAE